MTLLPQPVPIGNIKDAEAFVRHCMNKAHIVLTEDERDELCAEGLAILVDLHRLYDPSRDKSTTAGRTDTTGFFGFALWRLPRKLGDAWHRSQPHHVMRTNPDGRRHYQYLKPATSIDAHHTDTSTPLIDHTARQPGNFIPIPQQEAA